MMHELHPRAQLLEAGIITIFGTITNEMAEEFYSSFSLLALRDDLREIGVIINSPGGDLSCSLMMCNVIECSSTPVKTMCANTAMSGGLLLLMSGHFRYATYNSIMMSHRYMAGKYGDHEDLLAFRKAEDYYHQVMIDHYVEHSNLNNKTEVEKFLLKEADTYLTPQDALKYGLIDKVLKRKKITYTEEKDGRVRGI